MASAKPDPKSAATPPKPQPASAPTQQPPVFKDFASI